MQTLLVKNHASRNELQVEFELEAPSLCLWTGTVQPHSPWMARVLSPHREGHCPPRADVKERLVGGEQAHGGGTRRLSVVGCSGPAVMIDVVRPCAHRDTYGKTSGNQDFPLCSWTFLSVFRFDWRLPNKLVLTCLTFFIKLIMFSILSFSLFCREQTTFKRKISILTINRI